MTNQEKLDQSARNIASVLTELNKNKTIENQKLRYLLSEAYLHVTHAIYLNRKETK